MSGENTDTEKDTNTGNDYFCGINLLISNVKGYFKSLES